MIDWNAVTAIGTTLTAVVIAVTAVVGFHQLRLTRIQLEQLRRTTQLEGAMKIFKDLHSPVYIEARRFVARELPRCLEDPVYCKEIELGIIWTRSPRTIHHEQFVLRTFEVIGTYAQQGLLDRDVIVNMAAIWILSAWEHLNRVVEIQRNTIHPRMWENFEILYIAAKRWFVERSDSEKYEAWRGNLVTYFEE